MGGDSKRRTLGYFRQHHWGMLATFIALGGTAYATSQLPRNSVGSKQLKNGAVTTKKLANKAVTGSKINLTKLGAVPQAAHASSADTATFAALAPSSVVSATQSPCHAIAYSCTTGGFAWIGGSPSSVTLRSGQAVIVTVSTFASNAVGHKVNLGIGICAVPPGDPGTNMTPFGGRQSAWLDTTAYAVLFPISLVRIIHASDLGGPGTYNVGGCYLTAGSTDGETEDATIGTIVVNTS